MGKLIVVTREQIEESRKKFEELVAKDPIWQKEMQEMQRREAEEKKRRDEEYAKQKKGAEPKKGDVQWY